ncbi:MAG TPA: ornithine cyclodeaminase family protein [bacterium]|nr:ornithine cyclodeaminase family protein [bacterium]
MVLFLSEEDVQSLAGYSAMGEAIDALQAVLREQGLGNAASHRRVHVDYPPEKGYFEGRFLRILPSILPASGAAGFRVYTGWHDQPSFQGYRKRLFRQGKPELLLLYNFANMDLMAIISDYWLHVVRTAAPTGIATRYLAPENVETLALFGSGRHARGQVAAVCAVRPIRRVRVYSPTREHRVAFCREIEPILGVEMIPADSPQEAVKGAQVIVTVTNHGEPVFSGSWLEPAVHINSIGRGELDTDTLAKASRIVAELREQILHDNPPWEPAATMVATGSLNPDRIDSLAEIVAGAKPGRQDPGELTLFISAGSGIWDVALGTWVLNRAKEKGLGKEIF